MLNRSPGPPWFNCWVFLLRYVVVHTVESISPFSYLDSYVLNDTSISWNISCKPNTKIYLSLSTSEIPSNMFKPPSNFLADWCFFCGSFLLFVRVSCVSVILFCVFLTALWSPAEKGLTSWLSFLYVMFFLCLCHFLIWCPGPDVVFHCVDS